VIERPSPNYNDRPAGKAVSMLVLHYTGMRDAEAALKRLTDPEAQVSSHYLIDEAGKVYRLVEEQRRAWHAGVSWWAGEKNVNGRSIGIELVNPGHEFGYIPFAEAQIAAPIAQQTDGGTGSMAADGGAAGADGQGGTEASAGAGEAGSGGTTSDANDDVTSAVDATGGASAASGSSGSTGAASGAAATSGSAFSGGSRPSGGCSVSIRRAGTMPPAVASVFALLGIALARQRVVAQRRGRRRRAAAKHAVSASAATP